MKTLFDELIDPMPDTPVLVERLERLPPDVEARSRPMEDVRKDSEYLTRHFEKLCRKFRGEWVAVFNSKVVGHSPRSSVLWRELRKLGYIEKHSPVTFFMPAGDGED